MAKQRGDVAKQNQQSIGSVPAQSRQQARQGPAVKSPPTPLPPPPGKRRLQKLAKQQRPGSNPAQTPLPAPTPDQRDEIEKQGPALVSDGDSRPSRSRVQAEPGSVQSHTPRSNEPSALSLLQTTTALSLLTESPNDPLIAGPRSCADTRRDDPRYSLPFVREQAVAQALALISACTGDPRKVVAVCLEEGVDRASLSVKIAVNHGPIDDIVRVLREICNRLELIAALPSTRESTDERNDLRAEILDQAVALNRNRILCRLRSKHGVQKGNFKARKATRPPLLQNLGRSGEKGDKTAKGSRTDLASQTLHGLGSRLREVEMENPGAVESAQMSRLLVHVVESANAVSQLKISPSVLPKDVRSTISKIAQYHSATETLCTAATRYSVFRSITVEFVQLASETSGPGAHWQTHVTDTLSLIDSPQAAKLADLRAEVSTLQHHGIPVHAEIQLLFHHERKQTPSPLPPRTLVSSKLACYLCELFINLHGRFATPGTHGKLYPKWGLPALPGETAQGRCGETGVVVRAFEEHLQKILREMLMGARGVPMRHANESVVLGSAGWTPQVSTAALVRPDGAVCGVEAGLEPAVEPAPPVPPGLDNTDLTEAREIVDLAPVPPSPGRDPETVKQSRKIGIGALDLFWPRTSTQANSINLAHGITVAICTRSPRSVVLRARSLQLRILPSVNVSTSSQSSAYWVAARLLRRGNIEGAAISGARIIDVRSMGEGESRGVEAGAAYSPDVLYFDCGADRVLLKFGADERTARDQVDAVGA